MIKSGAFVALYRALKRVSARTGLEVLTIPNVIFYEFKIVS